jgi:hypothetical protein
VQGHAPESRRRWRYSADAAGLAWVLAALVAYFSPALWDGFSFGPADIGHQLSYLTYVPTHLPNLGSYNHLNGDLITQEVPWNTLDWLAVHHARLPLWNGYSGTGMPLMLNWESAPFALPTLVGYIFPLTASYLVAVFTNLLIAGTGTYLATRLAGAGSLGAAFAGTTFMLSGALSGWAGWAVSRPLVWAGWLLAGMLLCHRTGHRLGGVMLVAFASAFAVYGGFPETLALLALALTVVAMVSGAVGWFQGARGQLATLGRITAGLAGGAALSAPLWIPGIAVLNLSARAAESGGRPLPFRSLALLLVQGYDGLPTKDSTWFGPANYYESAAYVGVAALALAVVALTLTGRRPLVLALATTAVMAGVVAYSPAEEPLFSGLGLGAVAPARALSVLAFCIALLAGLGLSSLRRHWSRARAHAALLAGSGLGFIYLAYLWLSSGTGHGISAAELSVRRHALTWPAITLAGLGALAMVAGVPPARGGRGRHSVETSRRASRRLRLAGCALALSAQTAYLVWAGIGLNSYSHDAFPVNRAVAQLQRLVGNHLVALDGPNEADVTTWTGTGIYPEVNVGYHIRELAVHDPAAPRSYWATWPVQTATADAGTGNNVFAPSVTSAALARRYGAAFILASQGRVPTSATYVTALGTPPYELYLYAVPGAPQFSFRAGSGGRVLSVTQQGSSRWRLEVRVNRAAPLELRVTYEPGWRVTADGRTLTVRKVGDLFVGVRVPAGTRSVELVYWPPGLSLGFALALAAIAALLLATVLSSTWPALPMAVTAKRMHTSLSGEPEHQRGAPGHARR